MFAGIILILTLFQPESPCYLIMKGQHDRAFQTMSRLRNLPQHHNYLISELNTITTAHHVETASTNTTATISSG